LNIPIKPDISTREQRNDIFTKKSRRIWRVEFVGVLTLRQAQGQNDSKNMNCNDFYFAFEQGIV